MILPDRARVSFGNEVAQLEDDHTVDERRLNAYIAEASRSDFTAKDFRTWGASATVVEALATADEPDLNAAVDAAAERLGNTRAVCRASYIHPRVGESFDADELQGAWTMSRDGKWLNRAESTLNRILAD